MARLPPLNALKAFEAAGRHLNFRLAAEEIGVTQGAVAQQVRTLEARMGVALFERHPRGLALTEAGRSYLAPVTRAFDMISQATDGLAPRRSLLNISVTPSFASKWLVPRLGSFAAANPEIDVRISATPGLANFQSDGIDIAVRQGSPPFGSGLEAVLLCPDAIYAVCSPKLLGDEEDKGSPETLLRYPLLHDTHGLWPLYLEKLLGAKTKPKCRNMNFSQSALAVDAAIAGQGIALASHLLVADEIETGRLIRPFDCTIEGEAGYFVVTPSKPRQAKAVQKMRDWMLSQRETNFESY